MKKCIIFAISILSFFLAAAQDHVGTQTQLLLNKELRVRELNPKIQKHGYSYFLTTPEVNYKNIYKNDGNDQTPYNELVGKVFKVSEIIPYKENFMLKLENTETGTLYFKYSTKFSTDFHFDVIGGLPTDFYCGKLEIKDNGGSKALFSPAMRGARLIKETSGKPVISIRAVVWGDKAEVNKTGMIITLENGKVISKPVSAVDVAAESGGFRYSTVAQLTNEEVKLLTESPIVRIKLASFSDDFKDLGPLMHYARCMSR